MESEYLHFGLNLLIVLALLLVLAFTLKKVKQIKSIGGNQIKVLNVVSIGAKEKIVLIEVNGATLLVGATANQISTLHHFSGMKTFKEELLKVRQENNAAVSAQEHDCMANH